MEPGSDDTPLRNAMASMSKPTVAVVGASTDRSKFGNKAVRAHLQQGYEVFPVNPKGGQIEGLTVYRNLAEIPAEQLSRVSMYVPPEVGLRILDEVVAKGCDEFWLNPGSESDDLVEQARQLGLDPIIACSIVDVGVNPHEMDS